MPAQRQPSDRRKYVTLAATVGALGLLTLVAWKLGWLSGPKLRGAVHHAQLLRSHWWAVPAFLLLYVVLALIGLPAAPVTMAGGAIFGFRLGVLANWGGTMLGALAGYGLARIFRDGAAGRWLKTMGKGGMEHLAKEHGFAAIFRLRLVPVVPQNALSIAAGLSGVRLWPYVAATALGALPGTLVYTYFANTLLAGGGTAKKHVTTELIAASALLIAVSFAPTLVKRLRGRREPRAA